MVRVDQEKCIGCGMCSADCLAFNIVLDGDKATVKGECLECGHCVALCPTGAVSIEGYDMEGRKIHVRAREDLAICFQHEMDHLNGIIFVDHIDPKNPFKGKDEMRAI